MRDLVQTFTDRMEIDFENYFSFRSQDEREEEKSYSMYASVLKEAKKSFPVDAWLSQQNLMDMKHQFQSRSRNMHSRGILQKLTRLKFQRKNINICPCIGIGNDIRSTFWFKQMLCKIIQHHQYDQYYSFYVCDDDNQGFGLKTNFTNMGTDEKSFIILCCCGECSDLETTIINVVELWETMNWKESILLRNGTSYSIILRTLFEKQT